MNPSLTPPSSPSDLSSRLVTKRRCPFGESPQQPPKMAATCGGGRHVPIRGLEQYYNTNRQHEMSTGFSAFQIMMNSQRANASLPPVHSGVVMTSFGKCWVCPRSAETLPCAFCEHGACEMCVRQCNKCCGVFCSFCSTINYDQHEDCALCLTCHAEEFRKLKTKHDSSQVQPWGQSIICEQFPQVLA